MSRLWTRLRTDVAVARQLAAVGVTPSSIALYPLRSRMRNSEHRIELRNGVRFAAPASEPLLPLFLEVWRELPYTRPESLRLPAGGTVVDIGAHVGLFAIWAAQAGARVIALEPAPEMLGYLERNIRASGATSITVCPQAAGRCTGEEQLFLASSAMMNSMFPAPVPGSDFRPGPVVEVVSLDDLYDKHRIDRCDLLKLDCEGAEYDILAGAGASTLGRTCQIAAEYHIGLAPHRPEELVTLLEAHGFTVRTAPVNEWHGYLYARRAR